MIASSKRPAILSALALLAILALSFGSYQSTSAHIASKPAPQDDTGDVTTIRAVPPSTKKASELISLQPPRETLLGHIARQELGANASEEEIQAKSKELLDAWSKENYHGPDQAKYHQLLNNEQRALAAGSSPAAMGLAVTGTLRLFAVAVEFDGTDQVTDLVHPVEVANGAECITETLTLQGPLHNEIPQPGPRDNFSGWLPSYERDYYEKLVFSEEGVTERLRPELTDPEDGLPGIDVSGQTMRNYYDEVSGGKVQFDGGPKGVIAWIKLPHSEAYYGATACTDGESNGQSSMDGLPSNPEYGAGTRQLIADMITQINTADASFPWSDYDTDGDGYIDHVVIFHAGKDKSAGGGEQSWQALWAHRSSVGIDNPTTPTIENAKYIADDNGTPNDPSDDIRFAGYTMQYEDVETGVLVHEFGHDLGLPDLYDTSYLGESSVVWWDLMSTGSNTGKLIGTHPTHMGSWDKYALGWADYTTVTPTAAAQTFKVGQTSAPPTGTEQVLKVDLPPTQVIYAELPAGSTQAWWTNNDQSGANVSLTHDVSLTGQTAPISLSMDIDFDIEEDWDYLFVEASVDGINYTSLAGYEVGSDDQVTAGGPGYTDPNANLARFGGAGAYAYTGNSGGFLRVYHDLSAYAGQNIKVRLRYATDEATLERGAFIDNIAVTAGATTIFSDPVENNNLNGWVPVVGASIPNAPLGAGWVLSDATAQYPRYYLVEWRSLNGFDEGLRYTYNTVLSDITEDGREEFRVDKVPANAPGMLVWLRDSRYGSDPFDANNDPAGSLFDEPSEGPKGGLLIVDANPQPLRAPTNATVNGIPFAPGNNWRGRVQTINAAFNTTGSPAVTLNLSAEVESTTVYTPTTYAALPGVNGFHDALGYYPGVEELAAPILNRKYTLADFDASVVIPAKGYYPPKTPAGFTGQRVTGNPLQETLFVLGDGSLAAISIGDVNGTEVTGQHSGNPGSDNLQYGNHFEVADQAADGSYGVIRVYNSQVAADSTSTIVPDGDLAAPVTINANGLNAGSPAKLAVYSDFDENSATYVEGSATNGATPVKATLAQVQQILRTKGLAGLDEVRATPGETIGVVLASSDTIDSGATLSFSYKVTRKNVVGLRIRTEVSVNDTAYKSSRTSWLGYFQSLAQEFR